MNKQWIAHLAFGSLVTAVSSAQQPFINSLDRNGNFKWTYGFDAGSNTIARVEMQTPFSSTNWTPIYYDLISTNLNLPPWLPVDYTPPTNSTRTLTLPTNYAPFAYYRIATQSGVPDTNLVMHLTFQNDLASGVVVDSSGYENHGFRYQTNRWPSRTIGPDGNLAAEFHIYTDGFGDYGRSGDYVVVQHSPELDNLTNATIMVWARYYPYSAADLNKPWDSTLISADWDAEGSWALGRLNGGMTSFYLVHSQGTLQMWFPDDTPNGDSGGWHHYAVTWDRATLRCYFDGVLRNSAAPGWLNKLVLSGTYIGIGCWNFDQTPQLYDSGLHPNNGWITGAVADMRIYNRTLGAAEILSVYNSFDHQTPSTPPALWTRTAGPTQVELRWQPSSDNFYVAGYTIRRNGAVVGTCSAPFYADVGLSPGTYYSYTVEAFDGAGNRSGPTPAVATNTPPVGSPIEIITDDTDGAPWINIQGTWNLVSGPGCWGGSCQGGTLSGGALSVTYSPPLPSSGDYGVYLWYGGALLGGPNYVYAQNAPVDIIHNGSTNTVFVNEQQGYSNWAYLGTYTFSGTSNECVVVRSTAAESPGAVIADAVKFVK